MFIVRTVLVVCWVCWRPLETTGDCQLTGGTVSRPPPSPPLPLHVTSAVWCPYLHGALRQILGGNYDLEQCFNYCGKVKNNLQYLNLLDFSGLLFDDAIKFYLSGFRLPGEAQKVS